MTKAEDAFGFSVERESIGIYSSTNTRGFSPAQAGNVRIEGLYFDQLFVPNSPLTDNVSIKVGLSAQGYPFSAPSGIVDIALRRPASRIGASIVANADSFGAAGLEVDGSIPITGRLQIGYGATAAANHFYDGTTNHADGFALTARWRPVDGVEVVPFWSLDNDYRDEASAYYVPAGAFLPPHPPYQHFEGERWAFFRYVALNQGVVTTITRLRSWSIRAGVFRSVFDQRSAFNNILADLQSDGTGERLVEGDPHNVGRSLSGEIRASHSFTEGPRLHVLGVSVRGRDAKRQFGGTAEVDLGPGRVGEPIDVSKPTFSFGPLSTDRVTQTTVGMTYDGRWRNVGEIGISVGRSDYRDRIHLAGIAPTLTKADPWIGDATAAIELTRKVSAYAGFARGLEQSGVAPAIAANRNQPLPAILTSQRDAGIRWAPAGDLKVIVGIFDLRRPYYGFDVNKVFTQVGTIRSRGAEISLSGHLTKRLTVLFGGYLLDPRVERESGAAASIGDRPVGLASHYAVLNLNWQTPFLKGLSFDARLAHKGRIPSTIDDAVHLPSNLQLDPGGRYQFKLGSHNATIRLQISNLFDQRSFALNGPGVYVAQMPRYVQGYLAIDL